LASVGLIPWADIVEVVETQNAFKQKLIVLVVKNPMAYINKASQMRESRQAQYRQFGSPIVITAASLNYDANELVSTLKNLLAMKS
jgi:hypothetical protein